MRLVSSDGAVVDLRPIGYQFPDMSPVSNEDWDVNWLMVHGDVRLADGRAWAFDDPSLTTWEAAEISAWLRSVVSGQARLAAPDGGPESPMLMFTEPNLAFDLAARDDREATIRVYFSVESQPPWDELPGEVYEHHVPVRLSLDDVARAADDWHRELQAFPAR